MAVSNVVQLPALGNPSIDQMNTAQDHIYGWATPGATVKVHVHGVFIRDIGTDASGRWWTHLGFERGNAIVEAQQIVRGRPWSGWSRMVVQQLPQIILILHMNGYLGRGEPGATVKVHVHGVVIRDVGVDGAGNWATHIGRQPGGRRIEAQQYRVGRPWSGWVGLNVINKELGVPTITQVSASHRTTGRDNDKDVFEISYVAGRGEPGGRVCLNLPSYSHYWINVDGAGNWSIRLNHSRRSTFANLEVYQAKDGYPNNSRTALYHINIVGQIIFTGLR